MRMIDADELRKLFKEEFKRTKQMINDGETHLDTLAEGYTEAYHLLRFRALTVDAVPVVRCRDCIHREGSENPMCMLHTEPYANARGYKGEAVCVEMDDFCSYGKRRAPDVKE